MTGPDSPRTPTAIDAIADDFLTRACVADPVFSTLTGVSGNDHALTDYSPGAIDDRAALTRDTLRALASAIPTDDVDRVTVATMTDQLGRGLAVDEAGLRTGEVNVIESPLQAIRDVFDLMPTDTDEDRSTMLARVRAVPESVDSIIEGLRHRITAGPAPARRQVELVAAQAADAADALLSNIDRALDTDSTYSSDFAAGHSRAGAAFDRLRAVLTDEVLPSGDRGRRGGTRPLPTALGGVRRHRHRPGRGLFVGPRPPQVDRGRTDDPRRTDRAGSGRGRCAGRTRRRPRLPDDRPGRFRRLDAGAVRPGDDRDSQAPTSTSPPP